MGVNSRAKGHGFERQVCKKLNEAFEIKQEKDKYKRVPLSGGFDKDNFPGDIYSMNRSRFSDSWSIECKFYKDWKLEDLFNGNKSVMMDWWQQANNDVEVSEKYPLVIFKKNMSKTYFMAYEEDIHRYFGDGNRIPSGMTFFKTPYGLMRVGMFDELLQLCVSVE